MSWRFEDTFLYARRCMYMDLVAFVCVSNESKLVVDSNESRPHFTPNGCTTRSGSHSVSIFCLSRDGTLPPKRKREFLLDTTAGGKNKADYNVFTTTHTCLLLALLRNVIDLVVLLGCFHFTLKHSPHQVSHAWDSIPTDSTQQWRYSPEGFPTRVAQ